MKKLLIILFLITTNLLIAQEKYRVQYDYKKDHFEYLKIDKNNKVTDTLEKPKFKRNSLIEIKLLNVNPFAVKINTDVKEEELHQSSSGGFNFSSLLQGVSSMSNNDLGLNVNNNVDQKIALGSSDYSTRGPGVNSKLADLNNLHTNIEALNKSLIANLANPNLSKEQILKNLKNVASIPQDARIADPYENFHVYIASVKNVLQNDANTIATEINEINKDIENASNTGQPLSRGELVAQNTTFNNIQLMLKDISKSTNVSAQKLNEVETLYTTLQASSFEQTYDYEITADKVNVELNFSQSDFLEPLENGNNTLKTRNFKMFSKGGFKINTSIALTLNNFKSKSKSFYIDDNGVVGADDNSHYIPNLSTMINFYPIMGETINIGGSFGLSIPISESEIGVNYLFGPSIFIGNESRLSLSGGIAYGPVKKLTNGIEVGDTTTFNDIDSFTKNVHEFGYYFGISFSIFNLN